MLDTGSDVHLLTTDLAARLGLALRPGETGTDHAGNTMDSWLTGDLAVTLEAGTAGVIDLELHDVVVIPTPPPFAAGGIGGILSVHRLDPRAMAVLDLIENVLALVEAPHGEVRRWLLERRPQLDVLVLPRRPADQRPIIEAAIEPHAPVPVLVNTGGRHTEFSSQAVPGPAGGGMRRIGGGVSGADVLGVDAGPQVLRVGDQRIALPSVMVRESLDDLGGMLGMDALRGTVVVAGPDPDEPVLGRSRSPTGARGSRFGGFDKVGLRDTLCRSVSAALSISPVLRQGAAFHAVFR